MTGWLRTVTLCIALTSLLLTGCTRVQRGDSLIQLPDCAPGVTWHAEGGVQGGHSLPMHAGQADMRFNADCDGGPAQPTVSRSVDTIPVLEIKPGEIVRMEPE